MRSGLRWEEKYSDLSEATIMLYDQPNMGLYASEQPLQDSTPFWYYSSGTSNILSFLMAQKFDTHQEYLNYPYEQLFKPLGISDFTLETDSEGYYVMSSYGYGTARDWSKLGQLILQRGVWQRDTLYHTSWADFMASPAEGSNGDYGGHIWLNQGKKSPELSTGSLFMQGYQGQYVYIIPELDLVVVRLGNTYTSSSLDLDEWIITLAETIKEITESSSHQQEKPIIISSDHILISGSISALEKQYLQTTTWKNSFPGYEMVPEQSNWKNKFTCLKGKRNSDSNKARHLIDNILRQPVLCGISFDDLRTCKIKNILCRYPIFKLRELSVVS